MALSITVAGVQASLVCDEPRYLDYCRRHFAGDVADGAARDAPLQVEVVWHYPRPFRPVQLTSGTDGWSTLGRGLETRDGCLRWRPARRLDRLIVQYSPHKAAFTVQAHFAWAERWREARRLLRNPHGPERTLRQLTYFLLYYPAFVLAARNGWRLLHAGAVEVDGRGMLIPGAAGCGKSTLAVGLASLPGGRLLGDNLTLVRGREMRAVREPVRLGKHVASEAEWEPAQLSYSSRLTVVHPPPERRVAHTTIDSILCPAIGPEFGSRLLTPEELEGRVRLAQQHGVEILDARFLATALACMVSEHTLTQPACGKEIEATELILKRGADAGARQAWLAEWLGRLG